MRRSLPSLLALTLALISFIVSPSAARAAEALHVKGRWTEVPDTLAGAAMWTTDASHLMLLRGNSDSTRVLFWYDQPPIGIPHLWLWNATADSHSTVIEVPDSAPERMFCAGHVITHGGRALVVGGTDQDETGPKQVNEFDPKNYGPANAWGWRKLADMHLHRRWDQALQVGAWIDTLAPNPFNRGYHSCAVLLPDARVLTSSGFPSADYNKNRASVFWPPYLFRTDGRPKHRPLITGWPALPVHYGEPFRIDTPSADTIGTVVVMRAGSSTHQFDMGQSYVRLVFTRHAGYLMATAPDSNRAPPGDYMLFIVRRDTVGSVDQDIDNTPSIAKWIRLERDNVAPATVTDLYPEFLGSLNYVMWTAPGEDGMERQATAYDFRYSTQPITEANFTAATQAYMDPPSVPGTYEERLVWGLQPCTQYWFAVKTRDAVGNWSAISNVPSAVTCCSSCDDWLMASGGGESGGGLENGFILGPSAGVMTTDTYRLRRVSPTGLAPTIRLQQVGGSNALDGASIRVVDHDPGTEAHASVDRVVIGQREALARAVTRVGQDVTASVDCSGVSSFVAEAGETLGVQLRSGSTAPLLIEAADARLEQGAETAGILIEDRRTSGWTIRDRLRVRPRFAEFLVDSVLSDSIRLVFRGRHRIRFLGRLVPSSTTAAEQTLRAVEARHGRLGDVKSALAAEDGVTTSMTNGDTLRLRFSAPPLPEGKVRDLFLTVRGAPVSLPPGSAMRRDGGERPLPVVFALHHPQPNPFTSRTTIRFDVPSVSAVAIEVFDLQGRRIRTLARRAYEPGYQSVVWDRSDDRGRLAPAGVYAYRMRAGSFESRRKLVLLP